MTAYGVILVLCALGACSMTAPLVVLYGLELREDQARKRERNPHL